MHQLSKFVSKLEGYLELEVGIIRTTKINKVLKAILKLPSIPEEDKFNFKPRSQSLLDKWNKLLATEQSTVVTSTNGSSEIKADVDEPKPSPVESTNGAKENVAKSVEEKALVLKSPTPEKDEPAVVESASDPLPEKPSEVRSYTFYTGFCTSVIPRLTDVVGVHSNCGRHYGLILIMIFPKLPSATSYDNT